jgi:hypothetical protein
MEKERRGLRQIDNCETAISEQKKLTLLALKIDKINYIGLSLVEPMYGNRFFQSFPFKQEHSFG